MDNFLVEGKDSWICEACSSMNDNIAPHCSVCLLSQCGTFWVCPRCTFHNDARRILCSMCKFNSRKSGTVGAKKTRGSDQVENNAERHKKSTKLRKTGHANERAQTIPPCDDMKTDKCETEITSAVELNVEIMARVVELHQDIFQQQRSEAIALCKLNS